MNSILEVNILRYANIKSYISQRSTLKIKFVPEDAMKSVSMMLRLEYLAC